MISGAAEVLAAIGAIIAAAVSAYFLGQHKARKSTKAEMRVRDYENAEAVRNRADAVRVSEDDIKFRD